MLLRQKIGNWNVAGLCRWCVSVSMQWHSVDRNVTVLYIWAFVGVITAVRDAQPPAIAGLASHLTFTVVM